MTQHDKHDIADALGRVAATIWPQGDLPQSIAAIAGPQPATALSQMMRKATSQGLLGDPALASAVADLPSNLRNPAGGASMEVTGTFQTAYAKARASKKSRR